MINKQTNKMKKDYLYRYKNLENSIARLQEEEERWRTKAEKMTQSITDMPHGGNGEDPREIAILNMLECSEKAAEKRICQIKVKEEIEATIESVEDESLELLLTYRYIDCLTWEQVAVALSKSWRQTHRLHAEALNKINLKMA